jgi:hypothetical protein
VRLLAGSAAIARGIKIVEPFVNKRIRLGRENFATENPSMGRYLLLWLLGVPIPILILIWAFGGLH